MESIKGEIMKVYLATFHGDLERLDLPPLADSSLEGLLNQIVEITGWGTKIVEEWDDEEDFTSYCSPDPEDDKVEIWEIDNEQKSARVICGFFGWHWQTPEGATEMILPGHTETLMDLVMKNY